MREFLEAHHRGVLITNRKQGGVQSSPVVVGVDGRDHVLVSSRETAFKTRNLRRDPRGSLCVFTDDFFGDWMQIDVTAEVIGLPAAMDLLIDYYRRLNGDHPNWDEYRAAMRAERRVLLRLTPVRVGPSKSG